MPDPANLARGAIDIPDAQIVSATVLDDATAPTDKVRCKLPDDDVGAGDGASWTPVVRPAGIFYPKRNCQAAIAFPDDGVLDPVLVWWEPAAGAEPDHTF